MSTHRKSVWWAVYGRYHVRCEDDHDSLADALDALYWGAENGDLSPEGIRLPDGEMMDDAEFKRVFGEHERAEDAKAAARVFQPFVPRHVAKP